MVMKYKEIIYQKVIEQMLCIKAVRVLSHIIY